MIFRKKLILSTVLIVLPLVCSFAKASENQPSEVQLAEELPQKGDIQVRISTSLDNILVWSEYNREKNQSVLFSQRDTSTDKQAQSKKEPLEPTLKEPIANTPFTLTTVKGRLRRLQGQFLGEGGWVAWLAETTSPEKIEQYDREWDAGAFPKMIPRKIDLGILQIDGQGKPLGKFLKLNQFVAADTYEEGDEIGNLQLSLLVTPQGQGVVFSSSNAAACISSKKQHEKKVSGHGMHAKRCPFFDAFQVFPNATYTRLSHFDFVAHDPEVQDVTLIKGVLRVRVATHLGKISHIDIRLKKR